MTITRTKIFPVEGQSPIILHDVPQSVELVGDITGDKGTNEVWDDTKRIEDFEVKITTLDEYSTGKPHKVIKRVDTLDESTGTWTEGTQETDEASEKTFNLSYKGHERDFEVKVIEGGESEEFTYFTMSSAEGTSYTLAVEAPTDEDIYSMSIPETEISFYIGRVSDIQDDSSFISVISSTDFKELYSDKVEGVSELEGDYFASCPTENWASHKCYYMTTEMILDEELPVVPVSSSSGGSNSPKVQIRYRWGMNDSHDLSVEKNITITERPRPVEPEEGEEDSEGVKSFNLKVLPGSYSPYTDEVLDLTGAFMKNGKYQIYYHDVGDSWDWWEYLYVSRLGDLEDWLKDAYYNFDAKDDWYICTDEVFVTEGSKAYVVYGTEENKYYINDDGTRVDL